MFKKFKNPKHSHNTRVSQTLCSLHTLQCSHCRSSRRRATRWCSRRPPLWALTPSSSCSARSLKRSASTATFRRCAFSHICSSPLPSLYARTKNRTHTPQSILVSLLQTNSFWMHTLPSTVILAINNFNYYILVDGMHDSPCTLLHNELFWGSLLAS